jgi:hypothetical protein
MKGQTMNKIKITWKAFSDSALRPETSVEFDTELFVAPLAFCDMVFRATNVYSGALWDLIQPMLSPDRTHTALSVGDEVTVDNVTYRCEHAGWSVI